MSLNFFYGTADKNHHQAITTQIYQDFIQNPEDQFFLIVPNHIKFESEVNLMSTLQQKQASPYFASENVQVFSFSRLAWHFLKDTQFYQKNRLDSAAQSMILTKILQHLKNDLKIFRGELNQPGFLSSLGKQLAELQMAQIDTAKLQTTLTQLPETSDTYLKISDLILIYAAYQKVVSEDFITNDELLAQLSQLLATTDLSHMHFYLVGFTQLLPVERNVVNSLITNASEVTVALVLDQPNMNGELLADDLFFRSKKLQQQLVDFARSQKIVSHNTLISIPRVTPGVKAIGDYWLDPNHTDETKPALAVLAANDNYQEIEAVALKIHALVTDEGYHYRDFLVLTKHLSDYETVIKPIFTQFELPYFNDLEISMQDHPLFAFLTSLFAIDTNHFRYADIMGLLKTELLLPKTATGYVTKNDYRRQLDITDNYLLAHNLYQRDWLEATPWTFQVKTYTEMATDVQTDPVKSEAIETIHQLIRLNLAPFFDKLHRAKDAKTGARILYEFLKDVGVLDQLIAWENEAAQLNQTQQIADKNSQGFNVFIQLLDQYVAILGDSEFDVPTFVALLTAAFNNTAYAQIPSTLDAVSVSEVGIVQMNNRKMTFFIGLNDQNLPEIAKPETILNDEDRTSLATLSPEFDELPTTEHVMANESFLAYTAFLNPNSQLFLSYAKTNSEGVESKPSPYLQRLCTHFAMSPTQLPDNLPATEHIATLAPLIGTKRQVLHRLVPTLRQVQNDRQALGTPLTYIEKLLTQDKTIQHLARQVFSSLHYFNKPQPLKPKIVDLLFGDTLNASVSQLETFYRNPYAYFLTYGLKLQEREIYDLSPASRGSFYHEVMDEFMKFLVDQHLNIADLKEGQIDMILNEILDRVYQMPQYDILSSTGRMHYIRYKLKEILKISIRNNILQSQHMRFKPFRTEIPFGSGQNSLRSLDYKLDPQHKVRIRGKIDRIDTAAVSNNQFFNIIDYKSSDHDLKYQQVFYGLSLQMLTYVQSVLDNLQALDLPKAQFAGAYYFHLHNPVIKLKDLKSGIDTAAIDGKVLTDFRYKGLILNDEAVLQIADEKIDKDSQVVPLYYSKNKDTFSSRSNSLVTPAQLQTLLAFNAHKIQAAAQAIFAGQLPLEPVRFSNNNTALNFSPYLPIFQFDAMLPENNYRDLGKDPSKRSAVIDYWLDKMLHVLNQSD